MNDFYTDFISSYYKTYKAQQHPKAWEVFESFLEKEKFNTIIEIGTGLGGFTEFIYDLGYNIVSYDVDDIYDTHKKLTEKGVDIRYKNVFDINHLILDDEIHQLLKNGRVLVLCDGIQKAKEFRLFSKYIKVNDIIMAHDYCVDNQTFNLKYKDKEWKYLELIESEIKTESKLNSLTAYNQNIFDDVFWVCKIKN